MISLPAILHQLRCAQNALWDARRMTKVIATESGLTHTGQPFSVNAFWCFNDRRIKQLALRDRRRAALFAVRRCALACVLLSAATRHGGAA